MHVVPDDVAAVMMPVAFSNGRCFLELARQELFDTWMLNFVPRRLNDVDVSGLFEYASRRRCSPDMPVEEPRGGGPLSYEIEVSLKRATMLEHAYHCSTIIKSHTHAISWDGQCASHFASLPG